VIQLQENSIPVVILRSIAYCGLGIARSLGRLGVPVFTVEGVQTTPVFHSRYNRGRFVWNIDERPESDSLEYLRNVSTQLGGRPLLIPTTDYAALFVARNAKQLRDSFHFPEQPEGLVEALSSKRDMYVLAKRLGIPTPETSFPQKREDVEEFLASARLPVMLKAIDGTRLCARTGKKMFIVRSATELLSLYDKVEEPGAPNLMLQEYIPGGEDSVWMFNGYFNEHSECLLGFTGQKIRQCPAYTGYTSLGVCRRNEAVDGLTRRFMKSIGYRGILDVGYRYDARDGEYKVLDVNPRIGATFRLFSGDNGMDVARAFYLDMTAQPVPQTRLCEGRKWMVEDRDLMSSIRYWRDGNLGIGAWLRSLTGIREAAYIAADDMVPAFARVRTMMSTAVRRAADILKHKATHPSRTGTHRPAQAEAKLRAA
jgi:D-aspartate ligase